MMRAKGIIVGTVLSTNPQEYGSQGYVLLISTAGTTLGVYLNYKKEQRTAHKEDLQSAYDRLDALEEKLAARDKVIERELN